jgi:hypothetical protein
MPALNPGARHNRAPIFRGDTGELPRHMALKTQVIQSLTVLLQHPMSEPDEAR